MPKNVMCKNCNNYRNDWCEIVLDSPDPDMVRDCRHFWLKTNADRIRSMSDEELARQFAQYEYLVAKEVLSHFGIDIATTDYDAEVAAKDLLEQLQQPSEGE